jgi:hypothetical protein
MHSLLGLPLWAVALVIAAFVPFAARAWGSMVERRVRQRSVRLLVPLTRLRLGSLGSNERRDRPTQDGEAQS